MKSRIQLGITAAVILLGLGLVPAGCTYNRVQLAGGKVFSIERLPSNPLYVSWVSAEESNKETVVTGVLRSNSSYPQVSGHVDLAIFSPGGQLVGQTCIDYAPRTISTRFGGRESRFEAHLPLIPPDGSIIRVGLHQSQKLQERNPECNDNRAVKEKGV